MRRFFAKEQHVFFEMNQVIFQIIALMWIKKLFIFVNVVRESLISNSALHNDDEKALYYYLICLTKFLQLFAHGECYESISDLFFHYFLFVYLCAPFF